MDQPQKRSLAGRTLVELRDHYRKYFFDEYLPFWKRYGIDHELGGFMCTLDHDGTRLDDSKRMWYQGRGLWVYSCLYRNFGGDEHFEVARRTYGFLVQHGRDKHGDWVNCLDRIGGIIGQADQRAYDGLFVAEGMQAYAAVSGDEEAMQLALQAFWRSLKIIDDPERYAPEAHIPVAYRGQRILGHPMICLRVLTQLLGQVENSELEAVAGRMSDAIMNRFWNPEYQLINEALTFEYTRPRDGNEDFVYLGHAIETLWMVLLEAMRRKDRSLFDTAASRFRRHIELAWDETYGGVFHGMYVNGDPLFDKVLWAQEEVLMGCMILMEHTDWDWPWEWFGRVFDYVEEKFSLKPYGYPLYSIGGDRNVTFIPKVDRKENYHHPRCIMHCLLGIERILERNGAVSDFWRD